MTRMSGSNATWGVAIREEIMTWCKRGKRGQIVVLTSVSIVTLIGLVALATDVGSLYSVRRRIQTAADAAAVAGVTALRTGQSVTSSAKTGSGLDGFTDGQNGTTVTVNNPPATGTYAGNSSYVEVVVKQTAPTYFLKVLGYSSIPVSARAVAGGITGPACVYALDPNADDTIAISGNFTINASC